MNAETLNAYTNMLLFVVIFGGAAYALYRWSRPKTPPPDQVPQRPEGFKPRVRQEEDDEEMTTRPPITDWREIPMKNPPVFNPVQPPSFRPVDSKAPKPPTMKSVILKGRKPKASTGSHSPYHKNDDVEISLPGDVSESSEQKHCEPDRNPD